jgi:hypothetical protein
MLGLDSGSRGGADVGNLSFICNPATSYRRKYIVIPNVLHIFPKFGLQ